MPLGTVLKCPKLAITQKLKYVLYGLHL
jgi:hypothetical protein